MKLDITLALIHLQSAFAVFLPLFTCLNLLQLCDSSDYPNIFAADSGYRLRYQGYGSQSGSGGFRQDYGVSPTNNLRCFQCESSKQHSACYMGKNSLEDDQMQVEDCPQTGATRSYCYVWQLSMGDQLTMYRGCANSDNNPCSGPNYKLCLYRLCEQDLCNSSSSLFSLTVTITIVPCLLILRTMLLVFL